MSSRSVNFRVLHVHFYHRLNGLNGFFQCLLLSILFIISQITERNAMLVSIENTQHLRSVLLQNLGNIR